MSQPQQNSFNIRNEHLLLINILNNMYNDNINQIENYSNYINNLTQINTQIRNLLIQLLYNGNFNRQNNIRNNQRRNINRFTTNTQNTNTQNTNTQRQNNNLGRVLIDNIPYIVDSIQYYTIPSTQNRNININNREGEPDRINYLSNLMQNFLDPIEIYPTQSQIETATRVVRYCDILSPQNISCPISLDFFNDNDMVTVIRYCGHIFKKDEINRWFRSNCRCPICRYDIRNYSQNRNSESVNEVERTNSIDPSNNLFDENESSELSEERTQNINSINTNNSINRNNSTNNVNLLNNYSSNYNSSDTLSLLSFLDILQRQNR
jgi:hypothetical protein